MSTYKSRPKEEENQVLLVDPNDPDDGGYVHGEGEAEEWHKTTCPCELCRVEEQGLLERVRAGLPADQVITCKHCGAARAKGERRSCGCPAEIAERKADDAAADKKTKENNERFALQHARYEKEQEDKRRRWDEQEAKGRQRSLDAGRKEARRYQLDTELRDREQAIKERELTRSERRLDNYDAAAAADAEDTEEEEPDFESFQREITLLGVDRRPSAFVRDDGETLLYEGKANTIFGEPSSGKSWAGLMAAIQQLHAGRRVIWWDNEDESTTVAERLRLLRATDLIGAPELKFFTGDLHLWPRHMDRALEFLAKGNGPGLVMIDSATAFACPKDGADVHPWMASHVKPWLDEGHTPVTLDHVPKQRKDRPAGAVGSYEKISYIRGAALYVHGIAWDSKNGGAIHLTIHKDAHGQLPAPKFSVVSTISAEWDGPTLDYTIGLPNAKTEGEDLQDELMEAFEQVGSEGARGSNGVRGLLKGKRGKDIDKARDELLQVGILQRVKDGKAWVYTSVTD